MKKFFPLIVVLFLVSCSQSETETLPFEIEVSGEMLFEGANTLQGEGEEALESLAKKLEINQSQIVEVQVVEAKIEMEDADLDMTESFLLQIVSDNMELKSLASLNPIPDEGDIILNTAEETAILEYLMDSGTAWVLDLNLAEDHMEEMSATIKLKGQVKFKSE